MNVRLLVAGVGIALFGPLAIAEAQDAASWMRAQYVQVKPDKLEDFIELYRDEINPALRRAGVPWRSAWQTGEFGDVYRRLFVEPLDDFADLDTGGALARGLDARRLDRVLDRLREYTDSRQTYAVRYRPDLSVESDDVSGFSIARLSNVEVAPGRGPEFEAFLRENLNAFRAAGVVFGIYQRQFGPGPVVWQIVENLRSYSELGRGSLLRAFGDDSGRAASVLSGVVTSVERTVLEYAESMSYRAVDQTNDQSGQ